MVSTVATTDQAPDLAAPEPSLLLGVFPTDPPVPSVRLSWGEAVGVVPPVPPVGLCWGGAVGVVPPAPPVGLCWGGSVGEGALALAGIPDTLKVTLPSGPS